MSSTHSQKWALNSSKICPREENLPKRQVFKEYNFIHRTDRDIENYQSFFLKSDNIAIKNIETKKFNQIKPISSNVDGEQYQAATAQNFFPKKSNF